MGIGTVRDVAEARAWYRAAAEHGDKRANQRLTALGGQPVPQANELAGVGAGQRLDQGQSMGGTPLPPQQKGRQQQQPGGQAPPMRPIAMTAKEQGMRVAAEQTQRMAIQAEQARQQQAFATQPPNAPFPSAVERSAMSPSAALGPANYPTPMAMRDSQTAQREHAFQMAVQQQHQQRMKGSPTQSATSSHKMPHAAEAAYFRQGSPGPYQQQSRPSPGSPHFSPASVPYPSYPNAMSQAPPNQTVPQSGPISVSSPLSATPSEKKKSLWTQLKQI